MLESIFRHDFRILIADRTLLVFGVLFALLTAYGALNGAAWTHKRTELVRQWYESGAKALASGRQELVDIEQGRKSADEAPYAGWLFRIELPAAMPPAPLAPLSIGESDLHPFTASVSIGTTKTTLFTNYEIDNPATLLAGRFDLAFVIIYLYPLLIIALTYNLLAQEREQGTLALAVSQPVRLLDVALGKLAARLAVALGLAVALTLIGLGISGVGMTAPDTLVRLFWCLSLVIAYTFFWFALAFWVNALGRTSATNATALAGAWLLLVIIVPSLLSIAATSLYPAPPRLEFIQQMRRDDNEIGQLGERLLAQYHGDHPELASAGQLEWSDVQSRFFVIGQEKQRRTLPLARAYDEQLARQQSLIDRAGFLSPAIVMQEGLNAIAGAGRARHRHFRDQAEAYLDEWHAYAAPRSFRRLKLNSSDYDALPRFRFQEESNVRVTRRARAWLLGLLAPGIIMAWFASLALRRYSLAA